MGDVVKVKLKRSSEKNVTPEPHIFEGRRGGVAARPAEAVEAILAVVRQRHEAIKTMRWPTQKEQAHQRGQIESLDWIMRVLENVEIEK
jgi:hypothetical protein